MQVSDQDKITAAIALISSYGGDDGAHHKMWVIDQVLRVLLGVDYGQFIKARRDAGYDWDEGIEP